MKMQAPTAVLLVVGGGGEKPAYDGAVPDEHNKCRES